MRMLFLLFAFPLGEIRTLLENYIDLKMQSMEYHESSTTSEKMISSYMQGPDPYDYKLVPVSLPKSAGTVYAKVSPEDYDDIMNASSKWRMCSSGYPIFVKRKESKFETTYMHKLVFGEAAKHVNGDRLDNRRENLIKSTRKSRAKDESENEEEDEYKAAWDDINRENEWREYYGLEGKVPDILYTQYDPPFEIKTPLVVSDEMHEFKSSEKDLTLFNGYANIDYDKKKHYSGSVKSGIPHGYGHLYEREKHTQSFGDWENGKMKKGLVVEFKPAPDCMCPVWKTCPFREVSKIDVVQNYHRV